MKEIFDQVLETFENEDIRNFAEKCIENAPEYWHRVPASSTGKYHPSYSLGEGGLVRHTIAVVRFLNHMFGVESISDQFTSRERDLLRVAAIAHDMMKSGTQEDYEKSKWTKFDHPLLAARMVYNMDGLTKEERRFIAMAISSHMGVFNTDKRHPDIVLPKPGDKYQIILHLADYLASRKDVEMKFENTGESASDDISQYDDVDPKTCIVDFGKHKGMTVQEMHEQYPDYIIYLQKSGDFTREPCRTAFMKLGYNF